VTTMDTRFHANLADIRHRVDDYLAELFDTTLRDDWKSADLDEFGLSLLREAAIGGGKRIRPAFTQWAFLAGGGGVEDDLAIRAGAVFELLHTFALIHDDVMDEADTRRAIPTLHVCFAERHRTLGLRGSAQRYGENMAILLGDYTLLVCARLAGSLPPQAQSVFYRAATRLMHGQYLDLETSAVGEWHEEVAATTADLKTASYTVEGPLLIGAGLAPYGAELEPHLRHYGRAVGLAFQHRDDLLDIFGDKEQTGKPVGGDVVQHKATRLLEIARRRATGAGRVMLESSNLDAIRAVLRDCGAVAEMEMVIEELILDATSMVTDAPMTAHGRELLIDAARFVGERKW
jgi:geranylgeranyl diphosphate synthase type I